MNQSVAGNVIRSFAGQIKNVDFVATNATMRGCHFEEDQMDSELELKIVRVPREGRPTLSFHRGLRKSERDYQKMVDSGENIRVTLWYASMEEPLKRWERDGLP